MKKFILGILLVFPLFFCEVLHAQLEKTRFVVTEGLSDGLLKTTIESNVSLFFEICNKASNSGKIPDLTAKSSTKEGKSQLSSLWQTSKMVFPLPEISGRCLVRASGGYQVRNIPVSMLDAPEKDQNQDLVINFTKDGKIDAVYIAISKNRYVDILGSNISEINKRQQIISFIEEFRTSYNIKDMKYLEKIFSDQALIITGKVIKTVPNKDVSMKSLSSEKIIYQIQTKQEYMRALKSTFDRNKYIDVQFDEIKVLRHPEYENIFGVTIKQKWGSSTYNDTGYVFLLVEFKSEDHFLIHVRTWQPAMYNDKPLPRDSIYSTKDFPVQGKVSQLIK